MVKTVMGLTGERRTLEEIARRVGSKEVMARDDSGLMFRFLTDPQRRIRDESLWENSEMGDRQVDTRRMRWVFIEEKNVDGVWVKIARVLTRAVNDPEQNMKVVEYDDAETLRFEGEVSLRTVNELARLLEWEMRD